MKMAIARIRREETAITAINQGFMPESLSKEYGVIDPLEYKCGAKPTLLFVKSKTEIKERRKLSPKIKAPASAPKNPRKQIS